MALRPALALLLLAFAAPARAGGSLRALSIFGGGGCSSPCDCLGTCGTPAAEALSVCSGRDGWFSNKEDVIQGQERENCGWLGGDVAVCRTAWGKQQGGDEVLELARESALACMGCTAGCAACAGTALAAGLTREVTEQMATLTSEIIRSLREGGTEFAAKMEASVTAFLGDFVLGHMENVLSGDFGGLFSNSCIPGASGLDLGVRAGVAYYGGENCVCGACVPALNAMRPWVSWYIRARDSC
eukprot:evm.model.scf_595.3 EVM.evm.TU.scf_595.3   scf_595:40198-41422(-)